MPIGYEQTIRVLTKSNNRAAAELLKLAMDSTHDGIRKSASAEVISLRGPKAVLEYLQDLNSLDDHVREILAANPDKLVAPIRTAFLSKDHALQKNAVRAVLQFKVYDMIPVLLFMLTDLAEKKIKSDVPIAELLIRLTRQFVEEIEQNEISEALKGYVLHETRNHLLRSLRGFQRAEDTTCIKVFLLLGRYIRHDPEFNVTELFRNPTHPVYTALAGMVQTESDDFIFKFILDSLEAPKVPGLILAALSNRTDFPFLEYLFENMESPSSYFQGNLQRVHRFDWIALLQTLLPRFSEKAQQNILGLIHCSGLSREEIYAVCRQVYQFGKSAGRCAALAEIANLPFAESEMIVTEAVNDEDPHVQAVALRQIRKLNPTQGMMLILQKIDSPHPIVRETVKLMLPEFQIRRFLNSFDHLSEEQRVQTLNIVRKIDPSTPEVLGQEIQGENTVMKARALKSIEIGNMVGLLEESLCHVLLRDETAVLRVKAAALLAAGKREISRHSLLQATAKDTSLDVRLTAKASLERREKAK